jgi:hypothetical protein
MVTYNQKPATPCLTAGGPYTRIGATEAAQTRLGHRLGRPQSDEALYYRGTNAEYRFSALESQTPGAA